MAKWSRRMGNGAEKEGITTASVSGELQSTVSNSKRCVRMAASVTSLASCGRCSHGGRLYRARQEYRRMSLGIGLRAMATITAPYSGSLDSIPIPVLPGQDPRARLHKECR